MITLALDDSWEITLTLTGGLKMLEGNACTAQSVANAQRCFTNEAYYNMPRGIPYFEEIEGYMPPERLVSAHLERMARTVPGVVRAFATVAGFEKRVVTGRTVIETENGGTVNVAI